MVGRDRFRKQSFLGDSSQDRINAVRVGVVGLGGGGSHAVQQLAHIGFPMRLFDNDFIEESNLNRLLGGTLKDVEAKASKVQIALRTVHGVLGDDADVIGYESLWQEGAVALMSCQVVVGCVDSLEARYELERFCRQYMIPYVDIGMDVHALEGERPVIGGQVVMSCPGGPCLRCLGFLTEDRRKKDAEKYGGAGDMPQVVWPNGVLASTAVGLVIDLATGWSGVRRQFAYLSYDGKFGTVSPSATLKFPAWKTCNHFPLSAVGDSILTPL